MDQTSPRRPATRATHRSVLVAMAVLVATLTTGLGGGVAAALGTMTVTPSTGLIDGQSVHVSATGLDANRFWTMEQCLQNHMIEGCDPSTATSGPTDGAGNFSTDVHVLTILHTPIGTIDCRTNADACVLGASSSGGPDGAVSAVLAFDPDGPLLPPPLVHAAPATDLLDGQTVAVDGTGFRVSSGYREIRQCRAGATQASQCHSGASNYYPVEADGSFHGSIRLRGILPTDGGATIDCRTSADACELAVGQFYDTFDAVAAPISFDPDAPAADPPSVTVDPSSDLIDGDTVDVSGSGFAPDTPVGISESATSPELTTCNGTGYTIADHDGNLTLPIVVRARLWAGEIIDCRDPSVDCSVQAFSYEDPDDHPIAPITFDPDGPLLPPPTLDLTPSTDLVDGQIVSLHGTGYINPYSTVVSVPVADRRHPDARWIPPSGTPSGWSPQAPVTAASPRPALSAAESFQLPIVECVTTASFDIAGCNPETYTLADVDATGVLSGTAQVWAVFQAFDGRSVDCRTASDSCTLYTFFGDPLSSGSAGLDFDPNGPLAPPPVITVTPTTDLVDGENMHVVGDGFPANALVGVHQCKADQTGLDGCDTDLFATVTSDDSGHIDLLVGAKQVIGLGTDGSPYSTTFDCASAPGACRLTLSDDKPVSAWPSVTLVYASQASTPAPPPSQVVVQPQFTG